MKFFTPDLLERFGSEDERVALAAQEELEQRSEQYAQHLRAIEGKLPPRFRELQQQFYLHDARVVSPLFPWPVDVPWPLHPEMLWPAGQALPEPWPSFWLALQLDTPPREFLVLHYRFVRVEETRRRRAPRGDTCPYLEWQHDEVEIAPGQDGHELWHSILFTNGFELGLRFRDFDFATLKPLALPDGHPPARQKAPS